MSERAWIDSELCKDFKIAIQTGFHDPNVEFKSKIDTPVRHRYGPESIFQIREVLFNELNPTNVSKYDLKNVVRLIADTLQFREMRLYAAKNLESFEL